MRGMQPPQSLPAPQRWASSSGHAMPRFASRRIRRSLTPWQ